MRNSKIEWTESTWNPVTGCSKVSPGCKHCYAERMALRLQAMGQPNYRDGFKVSTHEHVLEFPLSWKKPSVIFVNSMSDLFHEDVPLDFISRVFEVMNAANWHQFQVLTKRAERMKELASDLCWSENIWMGVSVENGDYVSRVDALRSVPASIRFISFEPLIGPFGAVDLSMINWAIVGGESGPNARPMDKTWVQEIQQQCRDYQVPFFFKQWGGRNKKKAGRILNGRTWDEMPAASGL